MEVLIGQNVGAGLQGICNWVSSPTYQSSRLRNSIDKDGMVNQRLTGIYGEPNRDSRWHTWELLRSLKEEIDLPWCLIGILNNLGAQGEKRGGHKYPEQLIVGLCEALSDCGLFHLDLKGYYFTWERGRNTDMWTEERIDKAMVSNFWIQAFPLAKLQNLEFSTSDHTPILLILVVATGVGGQVGCRAWNKQVVEDLFSHEDASVILGIPLSNVTKEDSWYWVKEKRVSPKVKDLLWRALSQCLPTRINLKEKHVNVVKVCPLCDIFAKFVEHCFIKCWFAEGVWKVAGFVVVGWNFDSICDWFKAQAIAFDLDKFGRVVMLCRAI
uniref:Reverse transcriptase zinc-binding domain-containing protein n=1 Tax=Cannabis sativa TaxID=3483 RepID=A0A803QIS9_CANSA